MEFRISEGDGKRVYHLTGRFTHSDNDAFSPVIKDVGTGPGRTILLDLSGLDYLDSFGIGLFLVARDEARHSANRLEFGEPKGAVRKLFELAGLASLLSPDAPAAGQASARQIPGSFVHGASRRFTVSEPALDDRGTCRLALGGRFTFADHEGFQHVIDAVSSSPARRWEIDLAELEFMDSAALSMLLIARDQAHTRGVEMVLTNPRGRVRQLFDLANIPAMMAIEERERP